MIAHIDADAFFASVLQRDRPKLRGKPILALGMSGGTTVIAASYEAKRLGVRTGMRTSEARKLAPDAIALPADFAATSLASDQLQVLMERACPGGVEWASVDEGYLDVALCHTEEECAKRTTSRSAAPRRGAMLRGSAGACPEHGRRSLAPQHDTLTAFAHSLQSQVLRSLDLPISVGISLTKTLAKMCSKARKPRGICVVLADDLKVFLRSQPVPAIPGIGRQTTPKLNAGGTQTAWDFASLPASAPVLTASSVLRDLWDEVNGRKVYEIITDPPPPKSISRCRSFRPTNDVVFLYSRIVTHLAHCSTKLRAHRMECARLRVWLRTTDGRMLGAERKLDRHISEEALLLPCVREALEEALRRTEEPRTWCPHEHDTSRQPSGLPQHDVQVRSVSKCTAAKRPREGALRFTQSGLVLSDFHPAGPRQISLFEPVDQWGRTAKLQAVVDALRRRFGKEGVVYGGVLQ